MKRQQIETYTIEEIKAALKLKKGTTCVDWEYGGEAKKDKVSGLVFEV